MNAGEKFLPSINTDHGHFRMWGTRGSTPVSGQRYIRHGGNTSCMHVELGDEMIIVDAGTGIREFGLDLMTQKPRKLHILVTHTHWDHIQGFPFFTPTYIPGFEIIIYGPMGVGKDLQSIFKGQLDRDYFPVQMEDMRAKIEFRHLKENPLQIGNFKIHWEPTHHPGATVGFKIDLAGKKLGYVSDNEFLKGYLGPPDRVKLGDDMMAPYRRLVDFMSDMDVVISEAQYPNDEYQHKIGWGHSSISNACALMRMAKIRKWIVTHHDPMHDDEFLQKKLNLTKQIFRTLEHPIELSHGYDGRIEYL